MKAARQSGSCRLFVFGDGADRWRAAQLDDPKLPANLGVARFDDALVTDAAATVERQIRWSMTVSEGTIFVSTPAASFESTPQIWLGDPLGG